jgi:hypothetical protein
VVNALGEVVYHAQNLKTWPVKITLQTKGLFVVRVLCSDVWLTQKVVVD